MNKFKLPTNIAPLLKKLSQLRTAIVGVLLVGIFGYTAFIVNGVINAKIDKTTTASTTKITFDKSALKALTSRSDVPDQTALGTLGKPDPFAR